MTAWKISPTSKCLANQFENDCLKLVESTLNAATPTRCKGKCKGKKAVYLQALTGSPKFLDNRHMKVARLSAVRTGCLYPPGDILVLISIIVGEKSQCPQWGFEPSTSRLVSQCVNQLRYRVSPLKRSVDPNSAILIPVDFSEALWLCLMFLTDPSVYPLFPSVV